MLFNSFEYFFFFPLIAVLYFGLPRKARLALLLLSSYGLYYYWSNWYLLILIGSTLIDYIAGIQIGASDRKTTKKIWLWLSIGLNLGVLIFFKYINFFSLELGAVADPIHQFALPLGISFYTFQTISYTVDVYKGRIQPERNIGRYALYVAFFAQVAAGPIERAKQILPQFHFRYQFDYHRVVGGMQLILWGFFKKIVIADRLSTYVQTVYSQPEAHYGISIWLATYFFVFQIFCDFSAYSDMALGTARILGIRLSKNFGNRPYFATSFTDFWQEWHITLTRWVRDYVYMPLARQYRSPKIRPLLWIVVFLLIGLWHGAGWTFVVWGALNGIYLAVENGLKQRRSLETQEKLKHWSFQLLASFTIFNLTAFSAVFFGAGSLEQAGVLLAHSLEFLPPQNVFIIDKLELGLSICFLFLMEYFHYKMGHKMIHEFLTGKSWIYRWAFYILLLTLMLYFGVPKPVDFIYFDF